MGMVTMYTMWLVGVVVSRYIYIFHWHNTLQTGEYLALCTLSRILNTRIRRRNSDFFTSRCAHLN